MSDCIKRYAETVYGIDADKPTVRYHTHHEWRMSIVRTSPIQSEWVRRWYCVFCRKIINEKIV
jgi:hypothetical protein